MPKMTTLEELDQVIWFPTKEKPAGSPATDHVTSPFCPVMLRGNVELYELNCAVLAKLK